jgi:hypothetical protein
MPDPHGVLRLTGMQVAHLTGEELHVGAANAGALDVDNDLTGTWHGRRDVLDIGLPWPGDDESTHG